MTVRILSRKFQIFAAIALVACFCIAAARGQEDEAESETPAADVAKLAQQAYAKTKEARTITDYSQIVDICKQILDAKPSEQQTQYAKKLSAWALDHRGEIYVNQAAQLSAQGEAEEAAEIDSRATADFEAAVEQDPTRWQAIHNRGVSYAAAGRYDEAQKDFSRVIELNSEYPNAYFNRGEVLYALGRFEEALIDYNSVLRNDAGDFAAYISRGHAFFQLRRFREALDDYNQAVRLRPDVAAAVANRGDAYQSLGMWERAAQDYRRAIDLDDGLGRAYLSAAWLMATCPNEQYRDESLALEAAEKAIELDGRDNYRYLDTLAAAQANSGKFDEAKATLNAAVKAAPNEAKERLNERLALYARNLPYRQRTDASSARP